MSISKLASGGMAVLVLAFIAPASGQPEISLTIGKRRASAVVSWASTNTGYILQVSTNLARPKWTDSPIEPTFNPESGSFLVTNALEDIARFYRLGPAPVAVRLGEPRQIFHFQNPDALGMFNVPDMHTALLQGPNNTYRLWITGNIGTNGGSVAMLSTTDFLNYQNAGPGTSTNAEAVFTPSWDGVNTNDRNMTNIDSDYVGANAVLTATDGHDLLMFYEAGSKTYGATNYGHGTGEFNVMALARSTNGGLSWTREGMILSGPDPRPDAPPPANQPGIGEPGIVVTDGYIYMIYSYHPNNPTGPLGNAFVQIARAPLALDGAPGTWWKYYTNSWSQPGIGGLGDTILPVDSTTGNTGPQMVWPCYSTYLNAYLLTFTTDLGWFFSTSTDLLSWTTPVNFLPAHLWQQCQPMDWNCVFVTPGKPAGIIGRTGYVLYAHSDRKGINCGDGFSSHELWIRTFEWVKASN